jgi:hypothetical protein
VQKTRERWVKGDLCGNYTAGKMRQVIRLRQMCGWHTAADADGSVLEKIVFVHESCPLVEVVKAYAAGTRWFECALLERIIGYPIRSLVFAARLAKIGLAILTAQTDERVELAAADPRAAWFVNNARLHTAKLGFSDRAVIEAFLAPRRHGRRRVNRSDDRRLDTVEVLQNRWQIKCEDMLAQRRRVRLNSMWMFGPAA